MTAGLHSGPPQSGPVHSRGSQPRMSRGAKSAGRERGVTGSILSRQGYAQGGATGKSQVCVFFQQNVRMQTRIATGAPLVLQEAATGRPDPPGPCIMARRDAQLARAVLHQRWATSHEAGVLAPALSFGGQPVSSTTSTDTRRARGMRWVTCEAPCRARAAASRVSWAATCRGAPRGPRRPRAHP